MLETPWYVLYYRISVTRSVFTMLSQDTRSHILQATPTRMSGRHPLRRSPRSTPQHHSAESDSDWVFLVATITNHYRTHHQYIRRSGDVSCTHLLTCLTPSEVSHDPNERFFLFAIFSAAGYFAQYFLFGRVSTANHMMVRTLREYSRWDQRGRRQLSEQGLAQAYLMLYNIHWVLFISVTRVDSSFIRSWTTDNGNVLVI